MDPSTIGKLGNKVDESTGTGRVSNDQGAPKSADNRAASASDTVELTSRAQLLERLEKSLDTLPAVDSQRVAEIKAAIENGDYEIDATAIADAMIRFERSMGDK
ncbi:MAG: flagellar biosynthesis anti-sigma factor FlgM [Woeseiaceae bacterium]|nr:flagellar biosynthesis anti-sigma factor FlgM [Woeseiaceae bacterium]